MKELETSIIIIDGGRNKLDNEKCNILLQLYGEFERCTNIQKEDIVIFIFIILLIKKKIINK